MISIELNGINPRGVVDGATKTSFNESSSGGSMIFIEFNEINPRGAVDEAVVPEIESDATISSGTTAGDAFAFALVLVLVFV